MNEYNYQSIKIFKIKTNLLNSNLTSLLLLYCVASAVDLHGYFRC